MTRVVQVGFHLDRAGRDPAALLAAWPTLPGVASAVARQGVEVAMVQPAHRQARLWQHFEERLSWTAVGTRLAGIYRELADGSVREAR